jgi:hypothetical protein
LGIAELISVSVQLREILSLAALLALSRGDLPLYCRSSTDRWLLTGTNQFTKDALDKIHWLYRCHYRFVADHGAVALAVKLEAKRAQSFSSRSGSQASTMS